ncbi:hypothetical protein AWJ20_219 [Sugiyamaella lignohabitans]|uniref:Spindle pole body component n=1 Tax=Sugiyamaella lignohabitans TaxID=796027 RepID=A0A167CQN1_9ASCO|nr:uncharacterized protein AWJ20_219 [Sugiyamaella lignohabitans]ANB11991.1 hypothetical protein AWJ20_219 [Sugiyamaella lignohabitans]
MSDHSRRRSEKIEQLVRSIVVQTSSKRFERILTWTKKQATADHISIDKDAVLNAYDGLIEKFDVLGRSDLSSALQDRIEELTPMVDNKDGYSSAQCLALIKDLSVDPWRYPLVDLKARADLPRAAGAVPLTWKDIVDSEPLEGPHWEEVSEEETLSGLETESDDNGAENSVPDPSRPVTQPARRPSAARNPAPQAFIYPDPYSALEAIRLPSYGQSHLPYWMVKDDGISTPPVISTADILREIVFALLGLPSSVFTRTTIDNFNIVVVDEAAVSFFNLPHLSTEALLSILREFANFASIIAQLRQFSLIYFVMEHFQSFDYKNILAILDENCRKIETSILEFQDELQNDKNSTVSLLSFETYCRQLLLPYTAVVSIIKTVCAESYKKVTVVSLLDTLYDRLCTSDISGDDYYDLLYDIFCRVLQDYIEQLRPWLESGIVPQTRSFVVEAVPDNRLPTSSGQFRLVKANIAECFNGCSKLVLSAGKAAYILKILASPDSIISDGISIPSKLGFSETISGLGGKSAGNFADSLDQMLHAYFGNIEQRNNELLYRRIISDYHLKQNLIHQFGIYFMFDGVSSALFLERLFERIDDRYPIDRYSVADILEETWSCDKLYPLFNITAVIAQDALDFSIKIDVPLSTTVFKEIITHDTLAVYQSIWELQLHCRRIYYRLSRMRGLPVKFLFINFLNAYMVYLQESVLRKESNHLLSKLDSPWLSFQELIDAHRMHLDIIYKRSLMGTHARKALWELLSYGYTLDHTGAPELRVFTQLYEQLQASFTGIDDPVIQTLAQLLSPDSQIKIKENHAIS